MLPNNLRADCDNCFALCCVALPFAKSADFGVDKPAGRPCANLRASDDRCTIHVDLRTRGFQGCTVFECFGAGQQVSQVTFGGRSWRESPAVAEGMFEAFSVMRPLHELLVYVAESLGWEAARSVHAELASVRTEIEALTRLPAGELVRVDVGGWRAGVGELLSRTSELVRAPAGANHRSADLIGAKLRRADLRAANLRGAYLIAADLRRADLRFADMLGADLRDADVSDADLRDALYLTQPQVNATRGNGSTRLPAGMTRPVHWGVV